MLIAFKRQWTESRKATPGAMLVTFLVTKLVIRLVEAAGFEPR
jgi:hypothetical protein